MIYQISFLWSKLKNYIEALNNMPNLGKVLFSFNGIIVRQLIYNIHRILYYVDADRIIVVAVVSTARDDKKILNYIKRNLK